VRVHSTINFLPQRMYFVSVIKYSQILLHREVIGISRQSPGIPKVAAGDECSYIEF
jgi:hypothetical protein